MAVASVRRNPATRSANMPRPAREYTLNTAAARRRLKPRGEPYWRQIEPGLFLGYRRPASGVGTWVARMRSPEGGYEQCRIGAADDVGGGGDGGIDVHVVLSFAMAIAQARGYAAGDAVAALRHRADGWTVDDVVAYYLSEHRMAVSTRRNAIGFWRTHSAALGAVPVRRLNAQTLRRWHAGIAAAPRMGRGPGGTRRALPFDASDADQVRRRRASANRVLTVIKAGLAFAWRADKLPGVEPSWQKVQPFERVDADHERPPRMLDHEEVHRLLAAAQPDLRRLLSAALHTGCRYGELCSLRVRDFDEEHAVVRVVQHKTGKVLMQPLSTEGVSAFAAIAAGRDGDAFLLLRAGGRPWQRGDQARAMRATSTRAQVFDVTFKVTRATYGKLLLVATRDLELVARALGHADSRITRRHYAALLPSELAAGIARMPKIGTDID